MNTLPLLLAKYRANVCNSLQTFSILLFWRYRAIQCIYKVLLINNSIYNSLHVVSEMYCANYYKHTELTEHKCGTQTIHRVMFALWYCAPPVPAAAILLPAALQIIAAAFHRTAQSCLGQQFHITHVLSLFLAQSRFS